MAIVHFVNYKKPQTSKGMGYVLQYTIQEEKTVANDGNKHVTGVNCTPQSAYTEFDNTKRLYGKTDGRLLYGDGDNTPYYFKNREKSTSCL